MTIRPFSQLSSLKTLTGFFPFPTIRDRQTLLYALMADPMVDSLAQVQPMMEEMLEAREEWLCQFGE